MANENLEQPAQLSDQESKNKLRMVNSTGFRLFIVGLLVLLMGIPLILVSGVIDMRKAFSRSAVSSVTEEWGGRQIVDGPYLVIPVLEDVAVKERTEVIDVTTGLQQLDDKGEPMFRLIEVQKTVSRNPVNLLPEGLRLDANADLEIRHRGIFKVPVYKTAVDMQFQFNPDSVLHALKNDEYLVWDDAFITVFVGDNRGLRGDASFSDEHTSYQLEPLPNSGESGVSALVGTVTSDQKFEMKFELNGGGDLKFTPPARDNQIRLTANWPDPSFQGKFLPDLREVTDEGFAAQWHIPHLARSVPQLSRGLPHQLEMRNFTSFGVDFFQPNDFYQKAYRAARYGILFIALTFLTVFLMDRFDKTPTHPIQYILIGLAQAVFVLLMVSFSEHIGFELAFIISAVATIILITLYGYAGLKLGRRTWMLGCALIVVYAVMYFILQSQDYALLAGSILSFIAVGVTMFATRNEQWSREEGDT